MSDSEALKRAERKFEAVQGIIRAARTQLDDAERELMHAMSAMYDAAGVVAQEGESR